MGRERGGTLLQPDVSWDKTNVAAPVSPLSRRWGRGAGGEGFLPMPTTDSPHRTPTPTPLAEQARISATAGAGENKIVVPRRGWQRGHVVWAMWARGNGPATRRCALSWMSFCPNRAVSPMTMRLIAVVEIVIALVIWLNSPFKVLPRPDEVLQALKSLWMTEGLGQELMTSFRLNLEALGWSSVISLGLAYLTVIPVFRPLVAAISKGRFLSLVGFTFIFTLIFVGGHALKTALLVFAVTVLLHHGDGGGDCGGFLKPTLTMRGTLRMSEWRVVWEVVILGTADKAFEVLRQNAAMGWMMLTMVEGIVRSEGGVGAMLLNESKHLILADVFAIQFAILIVGLLQDYAIGVFASFRLPLCRPDSGAQVMTALTYEY